MSHAFGFKACYDDPSLKDYALPEAELFFPNLLNKDHVVSKTLMGIGWFKIAVRLHLGGKPLNKMQTKGGIKALELGWNSIVKQLYQKRERKNLFMSYYLAKSSFPNDIFRY